MPIYEYRCECNAEREVLLPSSESNAEQLCDCGHVMGRKFSPSYIIMKQTASGMALDSLNSEQMPRRHWTPDAEQKAFEGTG